MHHITIMFVMTSIMMIIAKRESDFVVLIYENNSNITEQKWDQKSRFLKHGLAGSALFYWLGSSRHLNSWKLFWWSSQYDNLVLVPQFVTIILMIRTFWVSHNSNNKVLVIITMVIITMGYSGRVAAAVHMIWVYWPN